MEDVEKLTFFNIPIKDIYKFVTMKNETPCLVNTGRGVSVLYKNRYLFSRFSPQKTLETLIHATAILPKSLILCLSPGLPFSFECIRQKLCDEHITDCFILGVECDKVLYDFFLEQKSSLPEKTSCAITCIQEEIDIALLIEHMPCNATYHGQKLPPVSSFKRIIVIESSGEVSHNKDFYAKAVHYAQDSVTQFWKNRITLVRLGKLFARNTIRNIACIPESLSIHMQSVTKPIVVVGAGPSLDRCIAFIKQHRDYVYILAIAAAARPLKDAGISPDAIVTVESQFATEKAFIGMNNSFVPLYADISSRPKMLSVTGAKPAFFLSEYYKSPLLERIKGFFPTIPIFPPLGSVSLSATELALALRSHSGKTPPVFVCGLDFAFSPGKTHCKESPHAKEYLNTCNRLFPPGNPEAAFRYGSFKISGKNDLCLFSDNSLKGYGMIFCERYAKTSELYDISPEGMPLDIPYCDTTTASHIIEKYYKENTHAKEHNIDDCINSFEKAHRFYAEEKNKLLAIRDILTKKNIFEDDIALQRIITLLEECNYVYMHFADAHKGVQIQRHFFNRVRAEIDVFLKDIEIAEKILAKSKQRPLLR